MISTWTIAIIFCISSSITFYAVLWIVLANLTLLSALFTLSFILKLIIVELTLTLIVSHVWNSKICRWTITSVIWRCEIFNKIWIAFTIISNISICCNATKTVISKFRTCLAFIITFFTLWSFLIPEIFGLTITFWCRL